MAKKLQLTGFPRFSSPLTYGVSVVLNQIINVTDDDAAKLLALTAQNPVTNIVGPIWTAYAGVDPTTYDLTTESNERNFLDGSLTILPAQLALMTTKPEKGTLLRDREGIPYGYSDGAGGFLSNQQSNVSRGGFPANSVLTIGDSFSANGLGVVSNTFISRQTEGAFNWFDWLLGGPFAYEGNLAAGGKTCQQMIDEQLPLVIAAQPRYVWMSCGHNDLHNEFAGESVTYERITKALKMLMDAGITPIWSTVWARSFNSPITQQAVRLNDRLRRFAYLTGAGLFYDGALATTDPSSANNEGRLPLASNYYDSTIHPNNLLCMRIGQFAAQALGKHIYVPPSTSVGNEGVSIATGGSNLLSNPSMQGTAGTVSANCTGTMPDGWVIDWATRTGTGSAAAAIVDIADATTGLVIARAIQATISGAPASGDVLRISQSNTQNAALASSLSAGNQMQAEGIVSLTSGAAVPRIDMRVQANNSESTWAGIPAQTAVTLPATIPPLTYRTQPIAVLGSGVATQARYDCRMHFNGNGAGSVLRLWSPRVRKIV